MKHDLIREINSRETLKTASIKNGMPLFLSFFLSHGDVFLPSAKSLRPLLNHNTGGLQVLLSGTCIQHTNRISDTPSSAGSHDGFNSRITAAFSVRTRVSLGFNDLFLERNVTEKHGAKGKRSQ